MSWHSGHGLQIGETNLKRGKMNSAYEKLDLRSWPQTRSLYDTRHITDYFLVSSQHHNKTFLWTLGSNCKYRKIKNKFIYMCMYKHIYIQIYINIYTCIYISTGPIRPSERQNIPRMHFKGVNMLIIAEQPMAVKECCSRYKVWIRLQGRDIHLCTWWSKKDRGRQWNWSMSLWRYMYSTYCIYTVNMDANIVLS